MKNKKKAGKSMKKAISLLLALVLAMSIAACSGNSSAPATTATEATAAATEATAAPSTEPNPFPMQFKTYMDMTVTISEVPERVIAANTNTADQLYAMGLGDKIIGVCAANSRISPEFQQMYEAAPHLAEKAATLEQLLDADPDFVYGRSSAFSEKNGTTHDILTSYGISSLSSIEGYKLGADVEDVYQDFYNLGEIFQLQDRANEIVEEMKGKIAAVETAIAGTDPVNVFVFDVLREDGAYTCGNNFTAKLIRHAGGINVFEQMEKTWAVVSWESVIDKNPDVIIINDYGSTSLEDKIAQLKENPALASVPAIQNDRIYSVTLCEVFASSMTAGTIEKFAHAFHPECFQ